MRNLKTLVTGAVCTLLLFGAPPTASAVVSARGEVPAPSASAEEWVREQLGPSAQVFTATTPGTSATTVCGLSADNPHWSRGAGSVIYKTRVACSSDALVHIDGSLGFVAGGAPGSPAAGPAQPVAASSESQWVTAGQTRTYYTPEAGGSDVRRSGTYVGTSRGQILDPCCSNIGDDRSSYVYVRIP